MQETWKPFRDSIYEVSNKGRVRNSGTNLIRKLQINRYGYYFLLLKMNGKSTGITVHRIVAETFISNPYKLKCVNHKDGNKLNNNVENLEWCTQSQNMRHAISTGLWNNAFNGEANGLAKLSYQDATEIREKAKTMSVTALAKEYGVNKSSISRVVNNRSFKTVATEAK